MRYVVEIITCVFSTKLGIHEKEGVKCCKAKGVPPVCRGHCIKVDFEEDAARVIDLCSEYSDKIRLCHIET